MFESSGLKIFTLSRIPVSVSIWYLVLIGMILFRGSIATSLPFALALTLSLLIHEFGHAFMAKYYALRPSVLLHGFGGLCMHDVSRKDIHHVLIVVMGPLVEIVVGVLVGLGLYLAPVGWMGASSGLIFLESFLQSFAIISVVWGAVNLVLPIWPLDGGQLFVLLLRRFMEERRAERVALIVSLLLLIPMAVGAIYLKQIFMTILLAFLAWNNYQSLQNGSPLIHRSSGKNFKAPSGKAPKTDDATVTMLKRAQHELDEGNWREAARLCHQVRSQSTSISKKYMDKLWRIVGLATMEMGEYKEAMDYLKRAPQVSEVERARDRCEDALRDDETKS